MMEYMLKDENGYDVATAVDGKQAIEMIDTEFFDLYLLDYCLPDLTAIELCRHIRQSQPYTPITIYSALDREVDKNHAFAAGANFYLVKPDELDKVKPHIEKVLGKAKQKVVETAAHNSSPPEANGDPGGLKHRRKSSGIM
jgi:DNA-binding response OmpR family regulator